MENYKEKLLPMSDDVWKTVYNCAMRILTANKEEVEAIRHLNWKVTVVDDEEINNAFVLPVGYGVNVIPPCIATFCILRVYLISFQSFCCQDETLSQAAIRLAFDWLSSCLIALFSPPYGTLFLIKSSAMSDKNK